MDDINHDFEDHFTLQTARRGLFGQGSLHGLRVIFGTPVTRLDRIGTRK